MPISMDIDLWGNEQPNGQAVEYFASEAVKNALQLWVAVKRGEYLMNPSEGGALDNIPFKTLNQQTFMTLKFQLMNALTNDFSPQIKIRDIQFIPDYNNRILEIDVFYTIVETGISDNITLFTNSDYAVNNFEYEDVVFTGDNLVEFFNIKKPSMTNARLVMDYDMGMWKWGKYRFPNIALPRDKELLEEIFIIANGS